jgi:hypothetical protein
MNQERVPLDLGHVEAIESDTLAQCGSVSVVFWIKPFECQIPDFMVFLRSLRPKLFSPAYNFLQYHSMRIAHTVDTVYLNDSRTDQSTDTDDE